MAGAAMAPSGACGSRAPRWRSRLLDRTALCGALALGIAAAVVARPAGAGPEGTVVVGGAVDVGRSGTHTEFTQHSQTALLNHNSFDIRANESVNFAQPSASALAVNRVVGSDLPTSIAGTLTANGNVWVLNPSGVAIRGTAQVNVGGLLATTASISDEAIMAGERSFAGAPAGSAVTNAGTIEAGGGSVVLVAPVVSNTGIITTHGSDVALGAGSGFTVDFDGDGLTRFEVAPGAGVSLTNAGRISAQGGGAFISAASADAVQTSVVSVGGRVEATRIEQRGGVIYISGGETGVTEVVGTLDAGQAAGNGGRIAVTGNRVDIAATALVDASGAVDGGIVEIGGGLRGSSIASPVLGRAGAPAASPTVSPLPTARRTVVRRGARIAANAGADGDGGTVIVWADEATGFRGAIEARGGSRAGDGGFAEVSGRQGLAFDGTVDLTAAAGATGTLLLDPDSVTIVTNDADGGEQDAELADHIIDAADAPAVFEISAGAVAAAVTAAETIIEATNAITQQSDLALSGNNVLTYRTLNGDIVLGAAIIGAGNALTVEAGGGVTLSDLTVAALAVSAGSGIVQTAGATIDVGGAAALDAGGDVTLHALGAGSLTVAADDVGILGALDIAGDATFINGSGAGVGLGAGAGGFVLDGAELGRLDAARIVIDSGNHAVAIGPVTLEVPLSVTAGAEDVTVAGLHGTDLVIDSRRAVTFGDASTVLDSLTVVATSGIGQNAGGGLSVTGIAALSTTGDVALDAAANDFATIDVAGRTVTLRDAGEITLRDVTAGGDLNVTAAEIDTATPLGPGTSAGGIVTLRTAGSADIEIGGDGGGTGFTLTQTDLDRIATGALVVQSGGGDIAVDAVDATAFPLMTLTAGSGRVDFVGGPSSFAALTVSGASIGQVASIDVRGPAELAATGAIALALANDFTTVDLSGGAVSIADRTAIRLGGVDADALTVSAGGAITDTDGSAIRVAGATDLTAASGATFFDIVLDGTDADPNDRPHDFSAAQPLAASGEDITLVDADAVQLGTITAHAADAEAGNGNDGDLTVLAGGAIGQSPGTTIRAPGDGIFRTTAGAIVLTAPTNDLADEGSGHSVALRTPGDIAVTDRDSLALRASSGTSLGVTAADISIAGSLDFDQTVTLANGGGDLSLIGIDVADTDPASFDLTHADIARIGTKLVVITTTGMQGIDIRGMTLDAESLVLASGAGPTTFTTGPTSVAGDLTVTGASIGEDAGGAVIVNGKTALTASGVIFLGGAGNDFDADAAAADAVDTVAAHGDAVTLADRNAIALGTISASSLTVRAGGSITDTPGQAIEVAGTTDLTAQDGAEFFDVALDGDGAVPFDRPHDFGGTVNARGEDIVLHDRNAIVLGAIDANESGQETAVGLPDATIARFDDDGTGLPGAADPAAAGDLTVRTGGAIGDTGAGITVEGRTRLEARSGDTRFDITLDGDDIDPADRPHDFDSNAPVGAALHEVDAFGATVFLVDRNALALGEIAASGLTVSAGGSITDTAGEAIRIAGTTDLTAQSGAEFSDIALDGDAAVPFDAPHEFAGTVNARGEDIILHDANAIVVGAIDANASGQGAGTGAADGVIARFDDNGDGRLDALDPASAGDLTVRAGGAITDTAASIDVEGRTRLEARNGATRFDITLDGADGDPLDRPHNFDSDAASDAAHELDAVGADIRLEDRDAIALGDISAVGDLTLHAGGSITDTSGEAIRVDGATDILAADLKTADPADDDYFDIALDNPGTHDFNTVSLTGEGVSLVDRRDLTIVKIDSLADDAPDATLPDDGIYLEAGQGGFTFAPGQDVPLFAARDITLFAPNGSFDADPAPGVVENRLPDGLTFRSVLGGITLDLRHGFVVEDVAGTSPFTLDAKNGISRVRIGAGDEPEFFGIGTADFLERAQRPDFNAFFNDLVDVGDVALFRVTGDFALIARSPLTARVQNTFGATNAGAGTIVDGITYLGGSFSEISLFGSFDGVEGNIASLRGFRDAVRIGELALVLEESNTVNGCAILIPSSCQPIGSLLPNLGYKEGLLLGIRFVDPTEDLDDPFTNRGDEEEWE